MRNSGLGCRFIGFRVSIVVQGMHGILGLGHKRFRV